MDELLIKVRNGSQNAFAEVSARYKPLIESLTAKYARQTDAEDYRQEALIALYSAVMTYEEQKEAEQVSFGLYAKICIRNRLISLTRKRKPESVSEPEPLAADEECDPETKLLNRESYKILLDIIDQSLTGTEKQVLYLYLQDRSYAQIASSLGIPEKAVDNAMYRMKAKLRKRI